MFMPSLKAKLDGACAVRDETDWPVLACALGLACGIWTEDADFFGTGIAVWTTNRVEIFLKGQATPAEPNEE
jgi:predicted nucleic acid-binding protein